MRLPLYCTLTCYAVALCAADSGDMRIGMRAVKPEDVPKATIDETIKKLSAGLAPTKKPDAAPAPATGWEKSAGAAKLAEEARAGLEVYQRIAIPPAMPHAVPNTTPDVRARCAWVLGLSGDRRAMDSLLTAGVYDPDDAVRFAAAKALPLLEEPVALRKLVDLATSHDLQHCPAADRKNAAIALRRYGDKEAIDRILREVAYELAAGNPIDPHNKPRGIAKGLGTDNPLGMPDSIPDLRLGEADLYPAMSAMKEVTGQSFGKDEKEVKTWTEWWSKAKDKFAFKD